MVRLGSHVKVVILTSFACLGESNCVSADSTKCIDHRVTTTTFSNLECDFLGSHTVPTFLIKKASFVVEREKSVALIEIWLVQIRFMKDT